MQQTTYVLSLNCRDISKGEFISSQNGLVKDAEPRSGDNGKPENNHLKHICSTYYGARYQRQAARLSFHHGIGHAAGFGLDILRASSGQRY